MLLNQTCSLTTIFSHFASFDIPRMEPWTVRSVKIVPRVERLLGLPYTLKQIIKFSDGINLIIFHCFNCVKYYCLGVK